MLDILKKKIVTAFITFFVSIPAYWIIFPDSRGNLFITLVLIIIFIDNGPKLKIFLVIVFPVLTVYFIIYRIIDKKSSH
ncbi:hypothetical protein BN983_03385 [Halobacillus karajensis]|uniref:Uncharacterized protein n=1 Tax=Halobacillus karajensis TaxID=195088 RepID=A0A024P810_9BACI|nr:hypothetical protein BN983_03385 [Halobacillus karajensis]